MVTRVYSTPQNICNRYLSMKRLMLWRCWPNFVPGYSITRADTFKPNVRVGDSVVLEASDVSVVLSARGLLAL